MLKVIYIYLFVFVFDLVNCGLSPKNGIYNTTQCTLQISSKNCTDSIDSDCCNHGFCCKNAGKDENKNVCSESDVCCPSHLHCYAQVEDDENRITVGVIAKYMGFVIPIILLVVFVCLRKAFINKRRTSVPSTPSQNQHYQTTQFPQVNARSDIVGNNNYPIFSQSSSNYNNFSQQPVFGMNNSGYTYSNQNNPKQ